MSQRTEIIDDSRKYSSIGESPRPHGIDEPPYRPCWDDLAPGSHVKGHQVHKDFSAEMVDHFQWPGLYGVMSWFP